jgi:hypothetical protein
VCVCFSAPKNETLLVVEHYDESAKSIINAGGRLVIPKTFSHPSTGKKLESKTMCMFTKMLIGRMQIQHL